MEKIDISGVPETMIQTLYARAKESKKKDHKIYDEKAIEIVSLLDYDFSAADKDAAMSTGVIARTILLDRMVKGYVDGHPGALVINIACGMDTRFYRVDNGSLQWVNIDLPETVNVRKRFLKEEGRVKTIACSAMDEAWAREVGRFEGDTLVIVEGLTMYLNRADVKKILKIAADNYPNSTVFMEVLSPKFVGKNVEKSISKSKASFTWGAASGKELADMVSEYSWVCDRSLVETMPEIIGIYKVIGKIPFIRGLSNKICVLETKT